MSDISEGFSVGSNLMERKYARERQAREDAWNEERRARDRQDWTLADQARTESDGIMKSGLERVSPGPEPVDGFLEQQGLGIQQSRPPQGFGGVGNDPTVEGSGGLPAGITPRYQAPPQAPKAAPGVANPARQQALDMARLAQANRDYNGYVKAMQQVQAADVGAQAAQIYQAALNATPEQLAKWSSTFSDNAHIAGKAKYDSKTGLTTIDMEGGGSVTMNKAQAATYVAGLWKLSKQDPSGLTDISSISDKLAASAKASFDKLHTVAQTNNDAAAKANSMRNDNQRTANDGARLGLAKSAAREVSPEIIKKMNDIATEYETETDPAKRKLLEQQHRMLTAQAATQLNEPMQLGIDRSAQPKTLTDREKIIFEKQVIPAIEALGPKATAADVADTYQKFGLNPESFGITDPVAALAKAMKEGKSDTGAGGLQPRTQTPPGPKPGTYRIIQSMGRDKLILTPDGSQQVATPGDLAKLESYGYKQE